MASTLIPECLIPIFKYLEDDPVLLFPCILVNRCWCQTAIPILWSNPFSLTKFDSRYGSRRMFSLINTFISTLSQESKNTLITHEIKIPEVANLTFDYPSFLRVIDMLCIDLAVKDWFAHPNYGKISYTSTQIKLLLSILTTHLLHNSSFIDTLKISHTTIIKTTGTTSDIILDIIHQIPKTTKNCFSNLKEFQYNSDTPIMEDLFLKLSHITNSIERICFTIYKNMTISALTLLKTQRNLKELTIQYHIMYDILIDQFAISTFLDKSNTLTHLTLEKLFFPLNYLENFKTLQELSLTDCGYHDYNINDWLTFSLITLPNLKKLVYKNPNPIYLDIFAKFISNTNINYHFGSKLSQIIIQCCKFQNPDNSNLLLSSISSNCPLLSFYSGPISSKNTLELSQLLISCPFIKNLRLHPLTSICSLNNTLIPEIRSSFDPLLLELCKAPLLHLDTLTIVHGWKIQSNIFEDFLKVRQNNGNIDGILRGFNFYWNNTVVIGDLVKICEEYPDIIKCYGEFNGII